MLIHSDERLYPKTHQLHRDPYLLQFTEPFVVRSGGFYTIILPGFICDFFSVPRAFWWFQPPAVGAGTPAAGVHDLWYALNFGSRRHADMWGMYDILLHYEVALWKTEIMYSAVRLGGRSAWRNKTEEEKGEYAHFGKIIPDDSEELLETIVYRGYGMGELLQELYRKWKPEKITHIRHEMMSISRGDIDKELKKVYG